jgi:hypothetical protein
MPAAEERSWHPDGADVPVWLLALIGAGTLVTLTAVAFTIFALALA